LHVLGGALVTEGLVGLLGGSLVVGVDDELAP